MNPDDYTAQGPPRHGRPPLSKNSRRLLGGLLIAAGIGVLLAAVALGGGTTTRAVPGPTVTVLMTAPPATVTVTATPSATPGQVILKHSGTGNWNSPPFQVSAGLPQLTVTYTFTGNTLGGQPDNFTADIKSGNDDQLVANTIAGSGGATTTIYPDTSSGDTAYHLEIMASGSWSFTVTEVV